MTHENIPFPAFSLRDPMADPIALTTPLLALTVQQPWATAVQALGKRIENRSWAPPDKVLGRYVALHAGRQFDEEGADWLAARTGRMIVRRHVPLGAVVALIRIADVVSSAPQDPWFVGPWGWVIDDVVPLTPIPCRGHRHLWKVSPQVHLDIQNQLLADMSEQKEKIVLES